MFAQERLTTRHPTSVMIPFVVTAVLALVGLGCIGTAFWSRWNHQNLTERGVATEARVGPQVPRGNGSSPALEYSVAGRDYRWVSPYTFRTTVYEPGSKVLVYVDPEAPHRIAVDDFTHRWLLAITMGGLGAAMFMGSAFALWVAIQGRVHSSLLARAAPYSLPGR